MKIRSSSLMAIAILILIIALVAVVVWLFSYAVNPTLTVLLGVIVGAVFGVIGTTIKTIFLDPYERQRAKEEDAKMNRKALYGQLMSQYLLAINDPSAFIEHPETSFKSSTYTKVLADPTLFYSMLPDAEALDFAFSRFQRAHQTISRLEEKITQTPNISDPKYALRPQQEAEIRDAANYIRNLVIFRRLNFDLIKEVCDITPEGKAAVYDFEDVFFNEEREKKLMAERREKIFKQTDLGERVKELVTEMEETDLKKEK